MAKSSKVRPIRPRTELEEAPVVREPSIRWIVPSAPPPVYAHAQWVNTESGASMGKLTLCKGHEVEGAIYPPHVDVPRCQECTEAVKRAKGAGRG